MENQCKSSFYSPRTRQSSVSSIVSGRKTLLSKKGSHSGRYSVSGRSNQPAQVIARSEYNIAECYGNPLPVLVNEALTFSDRNANVSINCSGNGWAWAVCGRRLLVWQYKEPRDQSEMLRVGVQRRIASGQCRELSLPHCDIGHKATLVTVFQRQGQQMASCLAISPTGDIRYWPSIAHDGSSVDETGILEGQEFDEMINVPPIGYVLVTTTCTLVLFQVQLLAGRHTVVHRQIKAPSGFFGGIGRKFASIIIGMNSLEKENRLLKICAEHVNNTEWNISLLADRWIQKWTFNKNGEQLCSEDYEILQKMRTAFHQKIWMNLDKNEIEVYLIDMQPNDQNLLILAAASLPTQGPQLHYALITLSTTEHGQHISKFLQLKYHRYFGPENKQSALDLKFILNNNMAYAYNSKFVLPIAINSTEPLENEKIEFQLSGDKIMAAAVFDNTPLFFSRLHGLVCILACDFGTDDVFHSSLTTTILNNSIAVNQSTLSPNDSVVNSNLTMYELDPDEIIRLESNDVGSMKAAFIYHLKGNSKMCMDIIEKIASKAKNKTLESNDNLLDALVVKIAQDLADDVPAADPRWEQDELNQKHALGSSSSMQIVHQLREKNLAIMRFIEFLHFAKLWEKFECLTYGGAIKSTCHVLADLNEKIVAAISLKVSHNNYSKQIDEAITTVLINRKEYPTGSLTNQDLFYVKTSKIHEIFYGLRKIIDKFIQMEFQSVQISSVLIEINTIVLGILNDVIKFRDSKAEMFALGTSTLGLYEYLPWTAIPGPNSIREILLHLIHTTFQHGIRGSGEPELKTKHYQQISELIDFVLDGRRRYLESVQEHEKYEVLKKQYESQRSDLLLPLIQEKQYHLASQLAEKYYDFQSLMLICDKTNNPSRLEDYIQRFHENDFSQYAINWHLRHNKHGDIFERFKGNQMVLSQFLCDHPSLGWVQLIFNGELDEASRMLYKLAINEDTILPRRKSMLSIAKLAAYAADSVATLESSEIDRQLLLIGYQEQLPSHVLRAFGFDSTNVTVLKPEQVIELYICPENQNADETHFRKALDVLQFIDNSAELRQQIFCAAILRDKWTEYNINAPIETVKELLFFRLVDLCVRVDVNVNEVLPHIDELMADPELQSLSSQKVFHFLLKLCYEHIANAMSC